MMKGRKRPAVKKNEKKENKEREISKILVKDVGLNYILEEIIIGDPLEHLSR